MGTLAIKWYEKAPNLIVRFGAFLVLNGFETQLIRVLSINSIEA